MKVKFYLELEDGTDDTLGDFLDGPVVENPPSSAGDMGLIPDPTCCWATKLAHPN